MPDFEIQTSGETGSGSSVSGGVVSGDFVSGGVVSGGFVSGGVVSGGFVSGGVVSGGFVSGGVVSGGLASDGSVSDSTGFSGLDASGKVEEAGPVDSVETEGSLLELEGEAVPLTSLTSLQAAREMIIASTSKIDASLSFNFYSFFLSKQ